MSFKNEPIPAAAKAAGYTHLAIADDFDDLSQFDMSGSGQPGYTWYIDRPGGKPDLKPTDFSFPEESVLHFDGGNGQRIKEFVDHLMFDV